MGYCDLIEEGKTFQRLPFFPIPEDGETLYSLVSRSIVRSGLPAKHILDALTGQTRLASLKSAIPGNTKQISERLPIGHPLIDTDLLIEAHTSFPYFTYFDTPEQRAKARITVTETESCINSNLSLGVTNYRHKVSLLPPRFCNTCLEIDQREYGFTYFHREHQLPGVAVCWKHGEVLFGGCQVCNEKSRRFRGIYMAGRCACQNAISPAVAFSDIPADQELLKWFAEQSAFMVKSQGTSYVNARLALRRLYLRSSFTKGTLLDYSKIADEMERRYGAPFLDWLGYPARINGAPSPWISRSLTEYKSDTRSSAILYLLFIGLLCDSVSDFDQLNLESSIGKTSEGGPISTRGSIHMLEEFEQSESSDFSWGHDLKKLLEENSFRLSSLASRLGISTYELAKKARRQRIRIPISKSTIAKHGIEKIDAVKAELRSGVTKNEIKSKYQISDWTILLIELDELHINEEHKASSALLLRDKHRSVVLRFIDDCPTSSKIDLMKAHSGSYEFMLYKDKEWFDVQFANRQKIAQPCVERKQKVWPDALVASFVAKAIEVLLSPESRPKRITTTGVLRMVGYLNQFLQHKEQFVQTEQVLNKFVETQDEFLNRKILWAIRKMKVDGHPISINKLRRVAGVPASKLRERREFVIESVTALGAVLGGRSFFNI